MKFEQDQTKPLVLNNGTGFTIKETGFLHPSTYLFLFFINFLTQV